MTNKLIYTDPSIDGPNFRFGLGIAGQSSYFPYLPAIPEGPSMEWHLSQWDNPSLVDPASLMVGGANAYVPSLGVPTYSFTSPDGDVNFSAFGNTGNYTYLLSGKNGVYDGGGKNLFIETNASAFKSGITLDHPVVFSAYEKIVTADNGGIAQELGNNFTVTFNSPGSPNYISSKPTFAGFLQYLIADSRGVPGPYYSFGGTSSGADPFIYNVTTPDSLAFASNPGPLDKVSIDINAGVAQLATTINNTDVTGGRVDQASIANLANWSFGAVYVGIETLNGGGVGFAVAHPTVTTDLNTTYIPGGPTETITHSGPVGIPVLLTQQDDIRTVAGAPLSFSLGAAPFFDTGNPQSPTLSASMVDDSPLPSWLKFDPASRSFSGVTPSGTTATTVKLVATSSSAAQAAEAFTIYAVPVNPVLSVQQNDLRLSALQAFSFALDGQAFANPEGGKAVLSISGENGAPLPAWIGFDATTGRVFGTAPASGASQAVVVTATSQSGGVAAEAFHIYAPFADPAFKVQSADVRVTAGSALSFGIDPNTFVDLSGGTLSYSASGQGGGPLPSWLKFDTASMTFLGTDPFSQNVAEIVVNARNSSGGQSSESFHIYGSSVTPVLFEQAADHRLDAGQAFSFKPAPYSYYDFTGAHVGLTASNVNASALPDWIKFDTLRDTFSGITPGGSGGIGIRIDATSQTGGTSAEAFHIYWGGSSSAPDLLR